MNTPDSHVDFQEIAEKMAPRPRVTIVSGSMPPIRCGVGDYTAQLAKSVQAQGIEVSIISSDGAAGSDGIYPVMPSWKLRNLPKLLRAIRRTHPHVVHVQHPTKPYGRSLGIHFLPLAVRALVRCKVVVTIHEFDDSTPRGKLAAWAVALFANVIVTNTSDNAQKLGRFLGKNRVYVIGIGNNIPIHKVSIEDSESWERRFRLLGHTNVLFFGFVFPNKGVDILLDSVSYWPRDCQLVLASEYDPNIHFHQRLKKQCDRLNERVMWTGFLRTEEVSFLMQKCDIAVFPFQFPASLRNSSLVAAMSHGLPILTTGPVSAPLSTDNCYVLKKTDANSVASGVSELLENASLRDTLGKNARQVARQFEWSDIAKQHLDLYLSTYRQRVDSTER